MPHFGLMEEGKMVPKEAALLRAKLHVRCGRRRLQEGKLPEAITTLYDAVQSSMRWFALDNDKVHQELHVRGDELLEDDRELQKIIADKGGWDNALDFKDFSELMDHALEHKVGQVDREQLMKNIEAVLTKLGVMPFDENELPPEDPDTF